MPRLVQKCGYIRAAGAGRYMKYIATREGVEKLHGRGPVTQPQKELIAKILRSCHTAAEGAHREAPDRLPGRKGAVRIR